VIYPPLCVNSIIYPRNICLLMLPIPFV
jgi:hypothetical protein